MNSSLRPAGRMPLWLPFFVLAFGAAALHAPHIVSHVGDVNFDLFIHYNWAREFAIEVLRGNWYPRWSFESRFGLGEPVFITYSPLYYYAVALFVGLGLTTWSAMQFVAIASNTAFAWFVYAAARRFVPPMPALLAALAALLSPFLVMLHYKFHGLAWASVGYAAHGMLLWALAKPQTDKRLINGWAAVAVALAVGSHIISALVNLIAYSGFALAKAKVDAGEGKWLTLRPLAGWAITVAVGLALSAVYLGPALYYMKLMSPDVWVGDYRTTAFAWPVFTMIGGTTQWFSIQWPVAMPALLMLSMSFAYYFMQGTKESRSLLLPMLLAGATAAFFAAEISYPIWNFPNPISQINLPYRFVSVCATAAAFSCGIGLWLAHRAGLRRWSAALTLVLGLSVAVGVGTLLKASYRDGARLPSEFLDDRYSFESSRSKFQQATYLDSCQRDSKTCLSNDRAAGGYRGIPEYELIWAKRDAYLQYANQGFEAECQRRQVTCKPVKRTRTGIAVETVADQPTQLVLPLFFYPAWTLTVNGVARDTALDGSTGLMTVDLARGKQLIEITWRWTRIEVISMWVTIVSALGLFMVSFSHRVRRQVPSH